MISSQVYIQVDVIEGRFAILRRQIAASHTFTDTDAAHEAFVDAIVSQTFLDVRQVAGMFEGLFTLSQRFCTLVQVSLACPACPVVTPHIPPMGSPRQRTLWISRRLTYPWFEHLQRVSRDTGDPSVHKRQAVSLAADLCLRECMLYTLLQSSRLQSGHRAPSLRQLLLRLNFNGCARDHDPRLDCIC